MKKCPNCGGNSLFKQEIQYDFEDSDEVWVCSDCHEEYDA